MATASDITRMACTTPQSNVAAIGSPPTQRARAPNGTLSESWDRCSTGARLLHTQSEGCMQMKRLATLVAVLLALTAASVALAAGGMGKFKTKITGKGAKTDHGQVDGTWTIDLRSPTSGKVNLTRNGQDMGGGTYVISGSKITLTPKKNGSCTAKGKYTFKLTGKALTFKKISDTCTVRSDVLTAHPWTKIG